MQNGLYGFDMSDAHGRTGKGVLIVNGGKIWGADEGGVTYDGTISDDGDFSLDVNIPPGTPTLVPDGINSGTVTGKISPDGTTSINVLDHNTIDVRLKRLRDLP